MDRIEGSSTARAATWNDDEYDKPLPGAAQKTAANIANAPWLSDAAVGTKGVGECQSSCRFSLIAYEVARDSAPSTVS